MIRTVSTHTTGIEAHIVRCRLEHEGIPVFVAFEHHVWAEWPLSVALGGVRVQVPNSYYESAQTIVNNIIAGKYESELNTDELQPNLPTCPYCTSGAVEEVSWPWKVALLLLFMLNMPMPYTKHKKKCALCCNTWIAHEQRSYPIYVIFIVLIIIVAIFFVMSEAWCHWCRLHCENPYVCVP